MSKPQPYLLEFFAYQTVGMSLDLSLEQGQIKTAETIEEARKVLATNSHVWLKSAGEEWALLTAEKLDALERGEPVTAPIGRPRD